MHSFAALAVASFLLLALISINSQDKPKANHEQRETANQPSQPQPPPPAINTNIGTSGEADAGQSAKQDTQHESKPFMTHGEYVISVITTVYVIITFFTFKAIQKQSTTAQESAKAATRAANIADQTLKDSEKQFSISHRPWVSVSGGIRAESPLVFDGNGAHITVSYTLRNGGTAPSIGTFTIGPGLMLSDERTPLALADFRRVIDCDKVIATAPPGTIDRASNEIGALILPGDTMETKNYTLKTQGAIPPNTGRWNIWFPLCIRYKDEIGNFHGTGLLWQFVSSKGEPAVPPLGSTTGSFKQIGVGNESY